MSMEEHATKVELNDCDADIRKSSIVSRIYVEGYSTSLTGHDLVMCMRKHFASCGEVMNVYIPGYFEGATLNSFALIYLRGEGAEEKALKLSGSYSSRGDKLVVESYPFHAKHLDHKFAPMRDEDNKQEYTIFLNGCDPSLPLDDVKGMLYQELSKCGRVVDIYLIEVKENEALLTRHAMVDVEGIDTVEKLLQLSGCDRKGLENIKFTRVAAPEQDGASSGKLPPSSFRTKEKALSATSPEDPKLPQPPIKEHTAGTSPNPYLVTEMENKMTTQLKARRTEESHI